MRLRACLVLATLLVTVPAAADTTPQPLPFAQDWSNAGLITTDDVWTGVPGIVGYLGDGMTSTQLLAAGTMTLDVTANQTAATLSAGGVAEFDGLPDHVVALQGSGTADAPQLVITIVTTGATSIRITYNVRDIDGTADNSVQAVHLQYRVGTSGAFTAIPSALVADATTGPSLATLVTPVSAMLPAACENQPVVQLRILTPDAMGADEWVGIDDISISSTPTTCGNGAMDAGETCDAGPLNGTTPCGCTTACRFAASGIACGTTPTLPCDAMDTCDGSGVCTPRVASSGTVCNASLGSCDPAETCDGATTVCPPAMLAPPGTTCQPANGVCDPADTCNGTSAACPANVATDGTPCTDDGVMCNGAEACMAGACAHPSPPSCTDTDACTTDACVEATPMCTHTLRPAPGCCNTAADCTDGDACTTDACTAAGGVCTFDPIPDCCTTAAACDDGDACTTDTCDAAAHTCSHADSCTDASQPDTGVPTVDAGRDGGGVDGSLPGTDAGRGTPRSAGCACTAVGARSNGGALLVLGVIALVLRRRRVSSR